MATVRLFIVHKTRILPWSADTSGTFLSHHISSSRMSKLFSSLSFPPSFSSFLCANQSTSISLHHRGALLCRHQVLVPQPYWVISYSQGTAIWTWALHTTLCICNPCAVPLWAPLRPPQSPHLSMAYTVFRHIVTLFKTRLPVPFIAWGDFRGPIFPTCSLGNRKKRSRPRHRQSSTGCYSPPCYLFACPTPCLPGCYPDQ